MPNRVSTPRPTPLKGALSTMPAVRTFALYAALAVLLDFILQMTAFVALLSLDARRQDDDRCEFACCVTVGTRHPTTPNEGLLLPLMRKYYAPVLLQPVTRIVVVRSTAHTLTMNVLHGTMVWPSATSQCRLQTCPSFLLY